LKYVDINIYNYIYNYIYIYIYIYVYINIYRRSVTVLRELGGAEDGGDPEGFLGAPGEGQVGRQAGAAVEVLFAAGQAQVQALVTEGGVLITLEGRGDLLSDGAPSSSSPSSSSSSSSWDRKSRVLNNNGLKLQPDAAMLRISDWQQENDQ